MKYRRGMGCLPRFSLRQASVLDAGTVICSGHEFRRRRWIIQRNSVAVVFLTAERALGLHSSSSVVGKPRIPMRRIFSRRRSGGVLGGKKLGIEIEKGEGREHVRELLIRSPDGRPSQSAPANSRRRTRAGRVPRQGGRSSGLLRRERRQKGPTIQ